MVRCAHTTCRSHESMQVVTLLLCLQTALQTILASADNWQWDAFALDEASGGRALSVLGYHLLKTTGLIAEFDIPERKLLRWLNALESGYASNPYHNRTHAADVLQVSDSQVYASYAADLLD